MHVSELNFIDLFIFACQPRMVTIMLFYRTQYESICLYRFCVCVFMWMKYIFGHAVETALKVVLNAGFWAVHHASANTVVCFRSHTHHTFTTHSLNHHTYTHSPHYPIDTPSPRIRALITAHPHSHSIHPHAGICLPHRKQLFGASWRRLYSWPELSRTQLFWKWFTRMKIVTSLPCVAMGALNSSI